MMIVELHKNFEKSFTKLSPKRKLRVKETIELFKQNPRNPVLRNHALHGELEGYRSIAAGGDLRLIFQVEGNYVKVLFIQVGTHNQIY